MPARVKATLAALGTCVIANPIGLDLRGIFGETLKQPLPRDGHPIIAAFSFFAILIYTRELCCRIFWRVTLHGYRETGRFTRNVTTGKFEKNELLVNVCSALFVSNE